MPRDMFGGLDPMKNGTKQWYTVPLSILAHVVALLVFVVVPLVANNALPTPESVVVFVVAPPPPPPPPPPAMPPASEMPTPVTPVFADADAAPVVAPTDITPEPPRALAAERRGLDGGLANRSAGSVMGAPPPLPPSQPVPVGGKILPPRKIRDAVPVYSIVARAAKFGGIVIVEATIARDGTVKDARILRGHALLNQAALDAVSQWAFSPTLLNGEAVEVIMSVTVNFTLQ